MSLDKVLYNFARRGVMPTLRAAVTGIGGPITMDSAGALKPASVGRRYYVAGNFGDDNNDGSSWDKAKSTLADAIAANNTNIAASKYGWAARNEMFITGDTFTEDLVAFPNKCDVIGVGSYDANDKPGILGNHAPVNAANYGTRFINVWLKGPAVASPIITLASTSSGIQTIECTFDANAVTTIGIQATASPFLKVIGCDFIGAFATSFITFGAGEAGGTRILDNIMLGSAGKGIVIPNTTTGSWTPITARNIIYSVGQWLDDDGAVFMHIDNRGITGVDCATYTDGFDGTLIRMVGNLQTGSNAADCDTIPHLLFA